MKHVAFLECMRYGHVFIARGQLHSRDENGDPVPSIWAWYCEHCHAQFGALREDVKLPARGGWRTWLRSLLWTDRALRVRDGVRSFFYKGYDVLPLLRRKP